MNKQNDCSKVQFFRNSSCQFSPVLFIFAVDAKESHPRHPKILHLDGNDDRYTTIAAVAGDFDDDGSGVNTRVGHSVLDYTVSIRYALLHFGYSHSRLYFPKPQKSEYDIWGLSDYAHIM